MFITRLSFVRRVSTLAVYSTVAYSISSSVNSEPRQTDRQTDRQLKCARTVFELAYTTLHVRTRTSADV